MSASLACPILDPCSSFPDPAPLTCYGEDLCVCLQLLGYKEYLDVHLQTLLKSSGSVLFVRHHVWCEPVKPQKLCNIFVYSPVPLLQSDKLFFHFLLSCYGKESLIETLRELVPNDGFSSLASFVNHHVLATSFN